MNHSFSINVMGMLFLLLLISMAKDRETKNSSSPSSSPRIKSITVALHSEANPTPFSEGCSVLLKRADETLEQRDISLSTSQSVRFDLNNKVPLEKISEYHIEFRRTNFLLMVNPWLMVLAQQRYAKSHRILANCRGVKDFRRFRNSQDGTWFSRSVLGA